MTYKEWMSAMGSKFGMSESDVELVLTNQSCIITDPEETVEVTKAKTALCKEFAVVMPLTNVTEGGYSLSWNMDAVKLWYKQTVSELGLADATTPRIRNKSKIW